MDKDELGYRKNQSIGRSRPISQGLGAFLITAAVIGVGSILWATVIKGKDVAWKHGELVATEPSVTNDSPPEKRPGWMWVTSQRADRYTCPNATCGVVGKLFFREGVEVMETRDKYVRVTKRYDAGCKSGKSEYIDSGRADCVAENGITDGKFAEWVLMSLLSDDRPADPAATASASEQFVAQSDDSGYTAPPS